MADDQSWKIPPIVQELAAGGVQELPSRYVVSEHHRPRPSVASTAMPEPVPIVDLSRLSDGADDEAAKLLSALQNWGLFLTIRHGMDPGFLAEMMELTRGFFNLPLDEKQKYMYTNLANGEEFIFEGYGSDPVVSEDQVMDCCDRLYLTVEPESRTIRSLWPEQPPAFADVLREYTARCRELAGAVLASAGRLLGLHEGRFVGMMSEGVAMTHARFNYYPRCPEPDRVFGLRPHSDTSVITVVLIDDAVSGLQVHKPGDDGGGWYDVPIVPNALVVNVGDATEIMSNGLFRSPVHRVVANAESDRVSLAMFHSLDPEKEMEPLPELVDDERPRRYRKTTGQEYLAVLFERFARGGRALDTVKIAEMQRLVYQRTRSLSSSIHWLFFAMHRRCMCTFLQAVYPLACR